MNTEKTKVSPLYLQLIEGMHRDKLKINDAKLARHGSIDIDDHGFIDFPEFTFEPETCEDGLVHGCVCIGRNFRRFLNEMPKYINPNSALACCWVGTFDRFAPFGIANEDKPHELDETIKKYRITQAGFGGMNHLCPDMEIGLREGWKGLLEKIRYYRKKNNPPDPDFYEGEEQLVLGILEWVKAHQVYAQELAAKESDPFLRDNYLAIAKVNGELCEHEPRTFREAVQFLAHFQAVDRTFYAGGALGALDTLLEEYFERDIESGILTEEEAVWMIASLFFNEYLSAQAEHPIWSPTYISISELFRKCSDLNVGDPVKLVCDLYKVFKEESGSNEALDDFYFWGEMLISDFDDADKNMADTETLFSNLKDLNDLTDRYEFLEEEQKEALAQFFANFNIEESTQLKQRFITTWDVLGKVYSKYKSLLKSQSIAYEGMMYREVTENFDIDQLPYSKYVFVGFNVLNKVEHTLFEKLNEAGKALFYWDYDNYYLNRCPHEAGEFIRRNLKDFPSELPSDLFSNLDNDKDITVIKSPTENGQARYLPQWIRDNLTPSEKETAVVLCNESLLQPVLHCLPENVKHINITMGFPLSQTPAYSFLNALIELHISGYNPKTGRYQYEHVASVLKHPYTIQLSDKTEELMQTLTTNNRFYPLPSELMQDEALDLLFRPCDNNKTLCKTLAEALKRIKEMK